MDTNRSTVLLMKVRECMSLTLCKAGILSKLSSITELTNKMTLLLTKKEEYLLHRYKVYIRNKAIPHS
jgi:hypothetical protein